MTTEKETFEAQEILKEFRKGLDSLSEYKLIGALDMAIEVLNHSEIPNSFGKDTNVPSNDTISRQAAIDALETIGYDFSDSGLSEIELAEVCEAVGDVRQDMIRMIKRLPPAQPERKKGKWIDGFMCSVCRKGYRSQPTIRGVPMFKYCPECGADMRGEQNEID